jgi:hypothetical protein
MTNVSKSNNPFLQKISLDRKRRRRRRKKIYFEASFLSDNAIFPMETKNEEIGISSQF